MLHNGLDGSGSLVPSMSSLTNYLNGENFGPWLLALSLLPNFVL